METKKAILLISAAVVIVAGLVVGLAVSSDHQTSADTTKLQTDSILTPQTPFTVNPDRFDPYKQCKFRVKWDGKYVPNIIRVSGLDRTTEVVTNRDGGEPNIERRSPGLTSFAPIVIERGRTHDTAFEDWANLVWDFGAGLGSEMSLADFRKDITIELRNEAGQIVMAWNVYRCWPSEYTPLAGLDANKTSVAIESIVLQHEGWERDLSVVEPVQP